MIKKTCFTGSKFEIKVILNRYRVRRKAVTKTSEKNELQYLTYRGTCLGYTCTSVLPATVRVQGLLKKLQIT